MHAWTAPADTREYNAYARTGTRELESPLIPEQLAHTRTRRAIILHPLLWLPLHNPSTIHHPSNRPTEP